MQISKVFLLCALLCVVEPLTMVAEQPAVKESDQTKGAEVEGCRLMISADKSTYHPMEPINVIVTIENDGEEPALIADSGDELKFYDLNKFDVTWRIEGVSPTGTKWAREEKVGLTREGKRIAESQKAGSTWGHTLEHGDRVSGSISMLNRIFDMTEEGEYKIVIKRVLPSHQDSSKGVEAVSNTLVVKVQR